MTHLDFVLWSALLPLVNSITNYLNAKTNLIKNKDYIFEKQNKELAFTSGIIAVGIYVYIACKLY
jgi:hypothetical protein